MVNVPNTGGLTAPYDPYYPISPLLCPLRGSGQRRWAHTCRTHVATGIQLVEEEEDDAQRKHNGEGFTVRVVRVVDGDDTLEGRCADE